MDAFDEDVINSCTLWVCYCDFDEDGTAFDIKLMQKTKDGGFSRYCRPMYLPVIWTGRIVPPCI